MLVRQVENFFPRLDTILPQIKKIKLYTQDEFNKINNTNTTWPGLRSLILESTNPILHEFICNLLFKNHKILGKGKYVVKIYLHLRTEEDQQLDWIHKDSETFAALIYISKTNLNSGTYLYDDNRDVVNDIKVVRNRFVLYSGQYFHKAYGHFGSNVDDGRLTINLFIEKQ